MTDPSPSPPANDSDPNSQIEQNIINQNIPGNQSQVTGEIKGGNAWNFSGNRQSISIAITPGGTTASTNSPIASKDLQIGENPYKGLDPFLEDDSVMFCGRNVQIDCLRNKFSSLHENDSTTRLLILFGASGSGKSSLARAGLIAKLKKEPLLGQESARYVSLIPRNIPLEELAKALAKIATGGESSPAKIREYKDELSRINTAGDYDGLRFIANTLPDIDNSPLILLVDQFEELFTICKDQSEQDAFIGNLLHAAKDSSKQVSVIITLRSDFLGKCPQIDQLIQSQGFFLAAMGKTELCEAISKPAELAGHPLDSSTVNLLIEQTKDREGVLPLLQFALEQIWVGLQNGKEPAETLELMGGIGGALDKKAEEIYKKLDSAQKEIARRLFLGLVQLGDQGNNTRLRANLRQLFPNKDSWEQVREVTTKFAHKNERLITLTNEEKVETAEVTHEALFENWKQFKDWLDEDRDDLRFHRRLEEVVNDWQKNSKPEGSLWRSPDLDLLQRYQEKAGNYMTSLQHEFFQASIDAEKQHVEFTRKIVAGTVAAIILVIGTAIIGIGTAISHHFLYQEFAYCPTEKGRPGKKIEKEKTEKTEKTEETVCFRDLITSGEVGIFLSSTNYHLEKGIEAFKKENKKKEIKKGDYIKAIRQGDYAKAIEILQQAIHIKADEKEDYKTAIRLFEQAINGDRSDPVPLIFLNNARARQRYQDLKIEPLKLAVVASIDYYEEAAKEVLRGVADAQDQFNESRKAIGNKTPLLEIVIANDENEKPAAKQVARTLVRDGRILGVVGHHASESTIAAQEIYNDTKEGGKIAVISPSSSSSKLTGENFFRTVGDTKKAAKKYVDYIKKISHSNKANAIVFYTKGSDYSQVLLEDFKKQGGQAIEEIDIKSILDIAKKIQNIVDLKKTKNLLILTSVSTNSVAIEIARANARLPIDKKLNLLGAMSLSEQETITKGGDYVNGMYLVRPCIKSKSTYMTETSQKWSQQNDSWRNTTSYDATKAFIKAIEQSKIVTRKEILNQLNSSSFSLKEEETSGFGLSWWDQSDRSNKNRNYCDVKIKNNKFTEFIVPPP